MKECNRCKGKLILVYRLRKINECQYKEQTFVCIHSMIITKWDFYKKHILEFSSFSILP